MSSYAILGGGISGLSAAYYLKTAGVKSRVILIESSNRLGGWINSFINDNGTLFELGPRTLRVSGNAGANTLKLAQELNLEDKINPISYDHVSARNRMIKVNNELHKLPNSLKSCFKKLQPFSKPLFLYLLRDLKARSVISNDESFYSFAQRRFGTEVAKYMIDPLCRGVFAGNAKDLSAMAFSRRIYEVEQKYNSVIKGMILDKKYVEKMDFSLSSPLLNRANREKWSIWSLKGGLQTLVSALEAELRGSNVEIITGTEVKELRADGNKLLVVTGKETFQVDKAISCLPANVLKNAIRNLYPDLYPLLNSIPFVSVGLVNLEYSEDIIKEPAFGYLVPSSEACRVLGVIYDSCVFPHDGRTVLTVMMGGYWFNGLFGSSPEPETLLNIALEEIRDTFKTSAKPTRSRVSIHKDCIPQYTVGHFERIESMKKLLSGKHLFLAGNSYEGVGVNDAIYLSKKTVTRSL